MKKRPRPWPGRFYFLGVPFVYLSKSPRKRSSSVSASLVL